MAAFRQLKPEHQHVLRLLTTDPPLAIRTWPKLWGRPQGSIGPLPRRRCIEQILRIMGAAPGRRQRDRRSIKTDRPLNLPTHSEEVEYSKFSGVP